MRRLPAFLAAAFMATVVSVVRPMGAGAATLNVPCSPSALATAINTANASGPSTLNLAAGCTYILDGLNPALVNSGNGPDGLPPLTGTMSINGNGSVISRSTAAGTPDFRLLEVTVGASVTARQLTLRNGKDTSGSGGGGIYNRGTLSLTTTQVINNTASTTDSGPALGGGILSLGTLTLSSSQIRDNTASAGGGRALGGGIRNGSIEGEGGPLILRSSVISGNVATSASVDGAGGGGIASATGAVTMTNSQVNANRASGTATDALVQGGGITARDQLTMSGSSVSGNAAIATGTGGVALAGGMIYGAGMAMSGSSVSGNTASATGGGGIALGGGLLGADAPGSLDSTIVSANTASAPGGTALGGGVLNGAGVLSLTSSDVSRNTASAPGGDADGGGIFNDGGTASLISSAVRANNPNNCRPPGSVPGCAG